MKLIPQDRVSRDSFLTALILDVVLLAFILVILPKLPPIVPLLYSRPWGEEQLVPRLALFIAPLGSLLFLIGNVILAKYKAQDWFLKDSKNQKENSLLLLRTLAFLTLVSTLVSSITVLRIALIIT